MSPTIVIIGAGLGGLVTLAALQKHNIPATVYERDVSASARMHLGGTLDLHEESGQKALIDLGLEEIFKKHSRPEGDSMRIMKSKGPFLHEDPPEEIGKSNRPEIDRNVLRQILLDAVPAGSVKWDHQFISAQPIEGDKYLVKFANGTEITADLLIGADGAFSKIRPLVSDAKADFTGITGSEISLAPETVKARPDIAAKVGSGMCLAMEYEKLFGLQMNGSGRIRVYAWGKGPADFKLPESEAEVKKILLEQYAGWDDWILEVIKNLDPKAMYTRPMYSLPVGHSWQHKKGITLVGDAAHAMPPNGEGANLAMLDGLKLGDAIGKTKDSSEWSSAIAEVEKDIAQVAKESAEQAFQLLDTFYGENAAENMVAMFQEMTQQPPPPE